MIYVKQEKNKKDLEIEKERGGTGREIMQEEQKYLMMLFYFRYVIAYIILFVWTLVCCE